mgnify:CR=1 FL=1
MSNQELLDEVVRLTCDLVAIPSVAEDPDQLRAVIDYSERYARAVPGVFVHRGEYAGKPHLIVTLRDTKTPDVMLNAHLDVVPGRPEQYKPEIRDGRIYARGSQDMKGAAAVLLRLMKDLAALDERPDVGFMFVSDEEIGGMDGTGYLLEQGWRCNFFLAAEPTDLEICFEQKGAMWVEMRVPGQPAHASRPWEGRNAFAAFAAGLIELEKRYPTPKEAAWATTIVPTQVQGGEAGNRLPEGITVTFDIRRTANDTPEDVANALRASFPTAQIQTLRSGPPLLTDPEDTNVQQLAACTAEVLGQPTRFYREHYASDARFYSAVGIPAVCFGPTGAGLHSDEEWVEIASLGQLYDALWRFIEQR